MYGSLLLVTLAAACAPALDPPPPVINAIFDPESGVIPMPNDALRDDAAARLDLPSDDPDLSAAEREFYAYLETLDGWSTTMQAKLELSGPLNPASVTSDTVQIWEWTDPPRRAPDASIELSADGTLITITPPRDGWVRGRTYVVLAHGGTGLQGALGEWVECDAAFYFLRQTEPLDDPRHQRAFPGRSRAERMDNARRLEELRLELQPYFDFFVAQGIPRAEIAALWSFTTTRRTELAMDEASQRMPLPFDILLDPETGLVHLPPAPWDSELVVEAKRRLGEYDGSGISMSLAWEATGPLDPATVTPETVQLFELSEPPVPVAASVRVLPDRTHVIVLPDALPLKEQTTYGIVVSDQVRDAMGQPIVPMPIGHFMRATEPIARSGRSQIGAVGDEDAARVEGVRRRIAPFLNGRGRAGIVTAWPFTTLTVEEPLRARIDAAAALGVPADPEGVAEMSPGEALADFPLAISSTGSVGRVITGTIRSPVYLDPVTRAFREDGGHEVESIPFVMTIPRSAVPAEPLRVMIFGHGLMTERRFVLAIGDALAERGFAAVAIDLPYHGTRTQCVEGGPISLPDPRTGELTEIDPCPSGSRCAPDGKCRDASGAEQPYAQWPVISYPMASGSAFIEVEHIASTKDHFVQALTDLGSLARSLRTGAWEAAIGQRLETARLYYSGQSLGGILGGSFVALTPDVDRAVLNVPGADCVDMFSDSTYFGPHIEAFFTREGIEPGSYEDERFRNVARWFMDAADPQSVAHRYRQDGRTALIQMATLDIIIPNSSTMTLERLSGLPRRDYVAEHGFLVIPVEPEYLRGTRELAAFLDGDTLP